MKRRTRTKSLPPFFQKVVSKRLSQAHSQNHVELRFGNSVMFCQDVEIGEVFHRLVVCALGSRRHRFAFRAFFVRFAFEQRSLFLFVEMEDHDCLLIDVKQQVSLCCRQARRRNRLQCVCIEDWLRLWAVVELQETFQEA